MRTFARIGLPALAIAAGAIVAFAPQLQQAHAQAMHATAMDPAGAPPDPTHIPIIPAGDIKWTGTVGRSQSVTLYGEPNTPGSPYGVLMKWYPGNFSRPHFHTAPRWIYVVSGTWWVSSSSVYNEKLTYPVHAGAFVQDMVNTIHWDGSRAGDKEPAVLLITGIGPAANTAVDENGKAIPRTPGGAAATTSPYGAAPAPGR
jgi:quercetin dioxygenase-like cupin family protein